MLNEMQNFDEWKDDSENQIVNSKHLYFLGTFYFFQRSIDYYLKKVHKNFCYYNSCYTITIRRFRNNWEI